MSKYLFVIPTLSIGGAERVVSILSQSLARNGEQVAVIKYYEADEEYPVDENVKVINISGGDRTNYDRLTYIKKVKKIRSVIDSEHPDYVIPFLYQVARCVIIAAAGKKVNVIQSIRNNPAKGPASRFHRMVRDQLVYNSKCTFVQNEAQRQYFNKNARDKIHVLYNPVSEKLFGITPKFDNIAYTIVSAGRLENQKNFKLLIDSFDRAFSDDENAILNIFGDGSQKNDLIKYISTKKSCNRIFLRGRSNDIPHEYEKSDLFALSSDYEGMPNALIEAMACGLPCVSTDCPTGPSELIEDGVNGYLVPVGDQDALAEALQKMKSNKQRSIRMGDAARDTVARKCKADNIAREMIQICESIK